MTKEEAAKIAAEWWTNQVAMCLDGLSSLSPEKLEKFQEILEGVVLNDLRDNDTGWDDRCPRVGSGLRGLATGWDPCPSLAYAAERAHINTLRFPLFTTMRIDPDGIAVTQRQSALMLQNNAARKQYDR